jgi:hypothetical protein
MSLKLFFLRSIARIDKKAGARKKSEANHHLSQRGQKELEDFFSIWGVGMIELRAVE